MESLTSTSVIVIGAGAAGLQAGKTLGKHGVEYLILEASDHYGGRLGKLENFADYPLDTGAQWLHGKKSILKKSLKKSKTEFSKDKSKDRYWFRGQLIKKLPEKITKLIRQADDSPDVSYADFLRENKLSDDYRYIVEQAAGDQGADASELSVKWNAVEEENWNSGNRDYKFSKTYFDFVDETIASHVHESMRLNTVVKKVDYRHERVHVTVRKGEIYTADKVIITVPITILQSGDISFLPALPKVQTEAFQKIGMGAGMKVFMKFNKKFYDEFVIGGAVCATYADESEGKQGEDHVLMAYAMGRQAEYLSNLQDDSAVTRALLTELDTMYGGQASEAFLSAKVIDWSRSPYIRGAYSYSKVGIGNARSVASRSVSDKLFFAGEAMNLNGHHQTVHGAIETGKEVANRIWKSI